MKPRTQQILNLFKTGNYSVQEVSDKLNIPKHTIYSDIKSLISFNKVEEKHEVKVKGHFIQYYGLASSKGIPNDFEEYDKKWKGFEINYNSFAKYCYRGAKD